MRNAGDKPINTQDPGSKVQGFVKANVQDEKFRAREFYGKPKISGKTKLAYTALMANVLYWVSALYPMLNNGERLVDNQRSNMVDSFFDAGHSQENKALKALMDFIRLERFTDNDRKSSAREMDSKWQEIEELNNEIADYEAKIDLAKETAPVLIKVIKQYQSAIEDAEVKKAQIQKEIGKLHKTVSLDDYEQMKAVIKNIRIFMRNVDVDISDFSDPALVKSLQDVDGDKQLTKLLVSFLQSTVNLNHNDGIRLSRFMNLINYIKNTDKLVR